MAATPSLWNLRFNTFLVEQIPHSVPIPLLSTPFSVYYYHAITIDGRWFDSDFTATMLTDDISRWWRRDFDPILLYTSQYVCPSGLLSNTTQCEGAQGRCTFCVNQNSTSLRQAASQSTLCREGDFENDLQATVPAALLHFRHISSRLALYIWSILLLHANGVQFLRCHRKFLIAWKSSL